MLHGLCLWVVRWRTWPGVLVTVWLLSHCKVTGSRDDRHWWSDDLRRIKAPIALPSAIKFDNVSHVITAKKTAKRVQHFHSVCFAYFLFSVVVVVALISLVPLPCKTILDHGTIIFCLKNRRFDGKRRTKSMSAGNHSEVHYWLEDSADRSFILAWCRSICPKGYPLNRKLYDPTHYFLRYCYLNHYAGWIRDRHTILLGDAFKGRNDPAVGSTERPFFFPQLFGSSCALKS